MLKIMSIPNGPIQIRAFSFNLSTNPLPRETKKGIRPVKGADAFRITADHRIFLCLSLHAQMGMIFLKKVHLFEVEGEFDLLVDPDRDLDIHRGHETVLP